MAEDYRTKFQDDIEAREYDKLVLGDTQNTFANSVIWPHEKRLVDEVLTSVGDISSIEYLDFAAGTGRIIAHVEDRVSHSTGIEISPAMIEVSRSRIRKSHMLCKDITVAGEEPERCYDVITAFRFFLKADPALRLAAMRALKRRLRNADSRLAFNIHGIAPALPPLRWLWSTARGARHSMTHTEVMDLVRAAGLQVVKTVGYAHPLARMLKPLSAAAANVVENVCTRTPLLEKLGVYRLYIVKLADETE